MITPEVFTVRDVGGGCRRVVLQLADGLLLDWLRGEFPEGLIECTEHKLPDDVRLVNVEWAWPGTIRLLLEHESFELVPAGWAIPEITPSYTRTTRTCGTCQHWQEDPDNPAIGDCPVLHQTIIREFGCVNWRKQAVTP